MTPVEFKMKLKYVGRRFNNWKVTDYSHIEKGYGYRYMFECLCDCGEKELHSIYEIVRSKECEHETNDIK